MKRTHLAYLALGVALAGGSLVFMISRPATAKPAAVAELPKKALSAKPTEAKPALESFVREHKASKDPEVQDRVGHARLRLAYNAAKEKDWKVARATFQQAAREYKGTGAMRADFGGVSDQALYQAAVCLMADGKPKEAEREFVRFIKERPLSPLVHAAYGRLRRLNGGEPKREWDDLVQTAVRKQEAHIRFETSVCGPKAIERLLPLIGKSTKDYKELAKLCGTTDHGTSLEGMRKGLKACGVEVHGVEVNREDFNTLPPPFLMLEGDHYVLVTKVEPYRATVYDPRYKAEQVRNLPALDDDQFTATVLTTVLPRSLVSAN